jgi:hypothetical protein
LQQLESTFPSKTFLKWYKSDQKNRLGGPGGIHVDLEDQVW